MVLETARPPASRVCLRRDAPSWAPALCRRWETPLRRKLADGVCWAQGPLTVSLRKVAWADVSQSLSHLSVGPPECLEPAEGTGPGLCGGVYMVMVGDVAFYQIKDG